MATFDDLLEEAGTFGRCQKRVFAMLCLLSLPLSGVYVGIVFQGFTPDHWCRDPAVVERRQACGWSLAESRRLTEGLGNRSESSCERYEVDWNKTTLSCDPLHLNLSKATPCKPENAITITIGISAEVLLNMEKEQQVEHGMQPFSHGPAFSFVKVLMAVNTQLKKLYPDSEELFDVVFMTNNHPYVGLRLINAINHHQLFIERFCMTGGNSLIGYLKAYHTNLYLSSDPDKVREALKEGIAAATMFTPEKITEVSDTQLRVAFDGDGVLFSDESERIFKAHGLVKFLENEKEHENKPLEHGPLKGFLEALEKLQKKFYDKGQRMDCPIRTYLVTARSASSSGYRALKTLRSWDLEMNEAHFLDGAPKGPILEKIRPHIFFDDKMSYVEGAVEIGTVACHVPYGISQV